MSRRRLEMGEIVRLFAGWGGDVEDLVLELREFVLSVAPAVDEKVAFKSLCYYKPDSPFGVIGGNVCAIGVRDRSVHLGFIHGAFLPDPDGLLEGKGKAKRHIVLRTRRDIRRTAFKSLILAAIDFSPEASSNRKHP